MYGIQDPLECLESSPPPKNTYKQNIITKIKAFHERELRILAKDNSAMIYLNVSLLGLGGRLHPAITGVTASHEVRKMRIHVKMLTGNYLTFEIKSNQSGGSPECRLCFAEIESLEHLISKCVQFNDIRTRIKTEMMTMCQKSIDFNDFSDSDFAQFALDPASMNLKKRVDINHPALPKLFQKSRDFCYSIDRSRSRLLN
jgi:hypothetical protein